ncbi:hypothetical protein PCE1_002106 [Barthelona sp. PCE]
MLKSDEPVLFYEETEFHAHTDMVKARKYSLLPKSKIRTSAISLCMCLNIGDPPPGHPSRMGQFNENPYERMQFDEFEREELERMDKGEGVGFNHFRNKKQTRKRTDQSFKLFASSHSWILPHEYLPIEAMDLITSNLKSQYKTRASNKCQFKDKCDPSRDDLLYLCSHLKRCAQNHRGLFHYNGHGVPPLVNDGQIHVFKNSTTGGKKTYFKFPFNDVLRKVCNNCVFVFDCPGSAHLINVIKQYEEDEQQYLQLNHGSNVQKKKFYFFGACSEDFHLIFDARFPHDSFTAILTTPIKFYLLFAISNFLLIPPNLEALAVKFIQDVSHTPTVRKSVIGELFWLLTAITDAIAWDILEYDQFYELFRQDILMASLFRHFLLAERIFRVFGFKPVSYPVLPCTFNHYLWLRFDWEIEQFLLRIDSLSTGNITYPVCPFWDHQLIYLENWLNETSKLGTTSFGMLTSIERRAPPIELPLLLQIMLSTDFRKRALKILVKYCDIGRDFIEDVVSVGFFQFLVKMLQSHHESGDLILHLWLLFTLYDPIACISGLTNMNQQNYRTFLLFLRGDVRSAQIFRDRAKAGVILSQMVKHTNNNSNRWIFSCALVQNVLSLIKAVVDNIPHINSMTKQQFLAKYNQSIEDYDMYVSWLIMLLASLAEIPAAKIELMNLDVNDILASFLSYRNPIVRALVCLYVRNFSRVSLFSAGQHIGGGSAASFQSFTSPLLSPISPVSPQGSHEFNTRSRTFSGCFEGIPSNREAEFQLTCLKNVYVICLCCNDCSIQVRKEFLCALQTVITTFLSSFRYAIDLFIDNHDIANDTSEITKVTAQIWSFLITMTKDSFSPLRKAANAIFKKLSGYSAEEFLKIVSEDVLNHNLYSVPENEQSLPRSWSSATDLSSLTTLNNSMAELDIKNGSFTSNVSHEAQSLQSSIEEFVFQPLANEKYYRGPIDETNPKHMQHQLTVKRNKRMLISTQRDYDTFSHYQQLYLIGMIGDEPPKNIIFHPYRDFTFLNQYKSVDVWNWMEGNIQNKIPVTNVEKMFYGNSNFPSGLLLCMRSGGTLDIFNNPHVLGGHRHVFSCSLLDDPIYNYLSSSSTLFPSVQRRPTLSDFCEEHGTFAVCEERSHYFRIFDLNSQTTLGQFSVAQHAAKEGITTIKLNTADPNIVYCGTTRGTILFTDLREGRVMRLYNGSKKGSAVVSLCQQVEDPAYVYTALNDGSVFKLGLNSDTETIFTSEQIQQLPGNRSKRLTHMAIHNRGPLGIMSFDDQIYTFNTDGSLLTTISPHFESVRTHCIWHPTRVMFAMTASSKFTKLYAPDNTPNDHW